MTEPELSMRSQEKYARRIQDELQKPFGNEG
jgi:hypothetical protein